MDQFCKKTLVLLSLFSATASLSAKELPKHEPAYFSKIMVIMFENMSYAEIKNEPTFRRLVEYTGQQLDENGRLRPLRQLGFKQDSGGNGYAFFSQYFNHHLGGDTSVRPSQPNYIAMISGSIHGITDDENHDINADNLAAELNDAGRTWKVYAENLPDPNPIHGYYQTKTALPDVFFSSIAPYQLNPNFNEEENDDSSHQYYLDELKKITVFPPSLLKSKCYLDKLYPDKNGYQRKHEPMISFKNIQDNENDCTKIVNSSHFTEDMNNLPDVSLYIPNQINDGHNGELEVRTVNANQFLSTMMGTDPKTGNPLPNAANAPFQQFMAKGGLIVITFDEPSVIGNPDRTIYTLLAGNMINSGVYTPTCFPSLEKQTLYKQDANGKYAPNQCNHYNLLKLMEANWNLRGLAASDTSSGYKYAFPLDNGLKYFWKNP